MSHNSDFFSSKNCDFVLKIRIVRFKLAISLKKKTFAKTFQYKCCNLLIYRHFMVFWTNKSNIYLYQVLLVSFVVS